jgi:hypothetical protein
METSQFEAKKIALRQDTSGFILTMSVHPDDLCEQIMRDFVGARYQVVMVRLSDGDVPMNRDHEYARDPVRMSAILCKDKEFARFLFNNSLTFTWLEEAEVTEWLREELKITSRAELKDNREAAKQFWFIYQEFMQWKQSA